MKTNTKDRSESASGQTEKRTLVLGASLKSERHSNMAIRMLRDHEHPVLALGLRKGRVMDVDVENDREMITREGIHTVTMYMNARRQEEFIDYILDLEPKRIIFNPGAENRKLLFLARDRGIEALEACTLVMLSIGNF